MTSARDTYFARSKSLALISTASLAMFVGACALPSPGPRAPSIAREASGDAPTFVLVPVDRLTLVALNGHVPEDLSRLAEPAPVPAGVIQIGDVVSVTLWEFGSGLLSPVSANVSAGQALAGAQAATVPNQTVDQTGMIIVPFAGDIVAAGRTTREVQTAIQRALRGMASNAQVLVQVVQTSNNAVTVTGDCNRPGRFPLAVSGTKLLDAVASAGGGSGKARDTLVQLSRGGVTSRVRMSQVLADPSQNIYLQPNDVITLDQEPQSAVVLGATNKNGEYLFGKSKVTLAEAIGNSGGLTDQQADPFGVFVLRYETPEIANKVHTSPITEYLTTGALVPVVYQVNFNTADGLLLAQNFVLRDRDMVYVSNAASVQASKLGGLFESFTRIFRGVTPAQY